MNTLGCNSVPFLFIIDFLMKKPVIIPLSDIKESEILFDINGITNAPASTRTGSAAVLKKYPPSYAHYSTAFAKVREHQMRGDSYLLNLTFPTPIEISLTLRELYFLSRARYKIWFRDIFLVFSPESFIRIEDGRISSYPMKGTINAAIPCAEEIILGDEKEFSEHLTIVDLIRNDLNIVADNVTVDRFRYVEQVRTSDSTLLQVSSQISGDLPSGYQGDIGSIITALLPAGSVSGAPKNRTIEIINEVENYDRGYYTGVAGYFDGSNLDSCVMIRYIEQADGALFYKSGGGITVYSDPKSEYQELIDKVYVPIV